MSSTLADCEKTKLLQASQKKKPEKKCDLPKESRKLNLQD